VSRYAAAFYSGVWEIISMATREKYTKVLKYVLANGSGVDEFTNSLRIDELTDSLQKELGKSKLSLNTIEDIINKLMKESRGVFTEDICRILGNDFYSQLTNPDGTPFKSGFWHCNSSTPFRK
jgi:hypothetical protein